MRKREKMGISALEGSWVRARNINSGQVLLYYHYYSSYYYYRCRYY